MAHARLQHYLASAAGILEPIGAQPLYHELFGIATELDILYIVEGKLDGQAQHLFCPGLGQVAKAAHVDIDALFYIVDLYFQQFLYVGQLFGIETHPYLLSAIAAQLGLFGPGYGDIVAL